MAIKAKYRIVLTFQVFLLLTIVSDAAQAESRTLTRSEDFVVLTGRDAPELIGADTRYLRLYACERGSCRPVPVQVDKMDEMGRYVFPADKNPERDGTRLDANDEIAFMAGDAGDRKPDGFRPAGAVRGAQIELSDPVDGGRAWLYLFEEPGIEAPDLPDYVSYRIEGENTIIESPQFVIGYQSDRIYYNVMKMAKPGGGLGPDVLDRQRVGMVAQLAGKQSLPLNAPESIIRAKDIAVIDGPVRVILDQVVVIHIANLNFQWGTEYFIAYYRCGQNNSVYFSFPASADKLVKSIMFYWSLDFTEDAIGSSYIDPHHPQPLTIKKQKQDELYGDGDHYWWGMYGPNGALLQALDLDDDVTEYFGCSAMWNHDPDARDRRGDHPGRTEIGFSCRETADIPEKQEYHWFNYILFPREPTSQAVKDLSKIFEHPLEFRVDKIE
jgi:hypothetical protein